MSDHRTNPRVSAGAESPLSGAERHTAAIECCWCSTVQKPQL